jgi:hypothetical protein
MLEFPDKRPENATEIYVADADMTIIEQQLRAMSGPLDDAFANHGATLTFQEPTKTKLAGMVLYLPKFKATMSHVQLVMSQASRAVDASMRISDLNMEKRSFAMSMERYQKSAFQKQVTYKVADLPE